MNFLSKAVLIILLLVSFSSYGKILTYNFSGEIYQSTSFLAQPFTNVGDSFNAIYTINSSASPSSYTGSLSNTEDRLSHAFYYSAILNYELYINGESIFSGMYRPSITIQELSVGSSSSVNSYRPIDWIYIDLNGGRYPGYPTYDDYGLLNSGEYLSSFLELKDLDGAALTNYAIPSNLDLQEFEIRYVRFRIDDINGVGQQFISGNILGFSTDPNEILYPIPEPSIMTLMTLGLFGLAFTRSRKIKQSFFHGYT